MKEMVGGCCVCSDDRGWTENPLVYCDGPLCTVAVHQACYGIVTVPTGNWYCRKCESTDRSVKVRCELCPNKEGALKPTDNNAWAHVVCALYIPEVRFGNVTTMEPIILQQIPQERYNKTCYICDENSRTASRSTVGACMQCNKAGCRQTFHVTCAQAMGLLCEEAGNYMDNVKYCGYCHHHYTKIKKRGNVKVIPPYRPIGANDSPGGSPVKETEPVRTTSKRKLSSTSSGKSASKSVTPVDENSSLDNTFETKSGLGSNNQELPQSEDSSASQTSQSNTNGSKRRKGGARTPPSTNTTTITGISPDASPRPITPLTNSIGNLASSGGTILPSIVSATSSGQPNVRPSSTGSTTYGSGNSSINSSNEKRQSGVVKEVVRPNSILVNVPLDAAMMPNSPNITSGTINTSNSLVAGSSLAGTSNIVTSLSPLIPQGSAAALSPSPTIPSSQLSTNEQNHSSSQQSQLQPIKRASRSQSSEKSDKGRRSSKRNSNSSSNSGNTTTGNSTANSISNSVPALSPPLSNNISHNATPSVQPTIKIDDNHQSTPPPPPLTSAVHLNNHVNDATNSSINRGRRSNSNSSANATTIKEEKDIKIIQTAGLNAAHMLGNQLNPTSAMAQKMCDTLSQEMVAHSVFNSEPTPNTLVGPQPPRMNNNSTATATSSGPNAANNNSNNSLVNSTSSGTSTSGGNNHGWGQNSMPQTLEQLLERQWEQGSQFLMEQAQHFDIASLLSCLHQLRAENRQLEEHVNSLIQRRDHLLAVNARLAIPLVSNAVPSSDRNGPGALPNSVPPPPASSNTPPGGGGSQSGTIVENGLPDSPRHDYLSSAAPPPPPAPSSMRQLRQQSGGSGGGQSQNNPGSYQPAQNSVLVRTTSIDPSRRSSHSPATSVFSSNSGNLYSHSTVAQSQQLSQQPQVVIRRDVISELGHHTSGGPGPSSQPPTLVPANQSIGNTGNSNNTTNSSTNVTTVTPQQQQQQPVVTSRPS